MANSSEIIQLVQRFRRGILNGDAAMIADLTRAYGLVWERIRTDVRQLTAQIDAAREAGEMVDAKWLFQNNRLQILLNQVEQEISAFSNNTLAGNIASRQLELVEVAVEQVQAVVNEVSGAGARLTLTRLPTEAIQNLIAVLPDGSPVSKILDELKQTGSSAMREALINGVAQGWNPRRIEEVARGAQGKVLSRALTVARTEALRPYREAQYQMRQNNQDIINGWYWLSAADSRTCASCWAMHGTFHRNNERLDDHPNGRCTEVPAVKGFSLSIETGTDRFAKLTAAEQRKVLSGEKYDLYKKGEIQLSDLVHRSRSQIWGTNRREASVREIQKGKGKS